MTLSQTPCPWASHIGHLALVVNDIEKAKWYLEQVWSAPYFIFRETQLIAQFGPSLLVLKLSKDAVDKSRQEGEFAKQVLDHYGFCADTRDMVDQFYQHILKFSLEIVKPPYDRSDGRAFYFRDPFGNLVEYLWFNP
jgi:catechol-2,3-dioxygenase